MEIRLSNLEIQALRETLEGAINTLLYEIARADKRAMREELKVKEELLKSIQEKVTGVRTAA